MNTRTIEVTIRLTVHGTYETAAGGRCGLPKPDPRTAGEIAKRYWHYGVGYPIDEAEIIAVQEPKAPRYSARAQRSLDKKRAALKEIWPA
tara:strand:+ start:3014 stop:3283 length:270 start_codon:yes stop_codon:yes gene_type:complete